MGFELWIAVFVIMLASLSGIIFVNRFSGKFLEERLPFLISFSAGVFLVTAGALALEVFSITPSFYIGAVLIFVGYLLAWSFNKIFPETHHHHDETCVDKEGAARRIIVGDAIHNIADGIILIAAFTASSALGLAVAISIVIHETLQEISEFFVLRRAGYSSKKALLINFAVSSAVIVGVLIGYFALASHGLEIVLLSISVGFFLQVVVHDLMPRKSHHETNDNFQIHVLLVVVGIILMGTISLLLGDTHEHGQDDGHGHSHESVIDDHDHDYEDEHHYDDGHDHDHDEDDHHDHDHDSHENEHDNERSPEYEYDYEHRYRYYNH